MEREEPNTSATPNKFMVPENETLNKPLSSYWNNSMQMYNNYGPSLTPFPNTNAAGSYMPLYMWPNQANSTLLQPDALHDPRMLSNKPTITGFVGQEAVWAYSEMMQRTFGEKDQNVAKRHESKLQPNSLITKKTKANGKKSSITKNDKDGASQSGSKGSPDEGCDANNDISSTKKQESNSTESNQTFVTGLSACDTNTELEKLDEDAIRKERKRLSNRESAKRSRMRRQQECEELQKYMGSLRDGNSLLTQKLKKLSEACEVLRDENDSIQEELVKMYGPESVADLSKYCP